MNHEFDTDKLPSRRPLRDNLFTEIVAFILHTRKWWLFPVLFVLLLLALFLTLSGSAAAPFIYTLF